MLFETHVFFFPYGIQKPYDNFNKLKKKKKSLNFFKAIQQLMKLNNEIKMYLKKNK